MDADSPLRCGFDHSLFGNALPGPQHYVRSGAIASYLYPITQVLVNALKQGLPSLGISAPDTPQVTFIDSRGDKLGERLLFQSRSVPVT
jgi:hypothetical protein